MEILATFARDFFIGVGGSVSDRGRVLLSGGDFLLFSSEVLFSSLFVLHFGAKILLSKGNRLINFTGLLSGREFLLFPFEVLLSSRFVLHFGAKILLSKGNRLINFMGLLSGREFLLFPFEVLLSS